MSNLSYFLFPSVKFLHTHFRSFVSGNLQYSMSLNYLGLLLEMTVDRLKFESGIKLLTSTRMIPMCASPVVTDVLSAAEFPNIV